MHEAVATHGWKSSGEGGRMTSPELFPFTRKMINDAGPAINQSEEEHFPLVLKILTNARSSHDHARRCLMTKLLVLSTLFSFKDTERTTS